MSDERQTALGSAVHEAQEWHFLFEVMRGMFKSLASEVITAELLRKLKISDLHLYEILRDEEVELKTLEQFMPQITEKWHVAHRERVIKRLRQTWRVEAHLAAESGDADA